ncbi:MULTISPECIES: hypothetical protein [unclassified Streptomyces]|uniref:hypothetical protein n=1 Tax=unclassified Streptomyces TaxID=2593676 RepID=UPI000CD4DEE0|nr:hypothetical protein [Streptomyces sp. SM10]
MTQISESNGYTDTTAAHAGGTEHPAGRISLGISGGLGLRSRLLRSAEGETGPGDEFPWTTFTIV